MLSTLKDLWKNGWILLVFLYLLGTATICFSFLEGVFLCCLLWGLNSLFIWVKNKTPIMCNWTDMTRLGLYIAESVDTYKILNIQATILKLYWFEVKFYWIRFLITPQMLGVSLMIKPLFFTYLIMQMYGIHPFVWTVSAVLHRCTNERPERMQILKLPEK